MFPEIKGRNLGLDKPVLKKQLPQTNNERDPGPWEDPEPGPYEDPGTYEDPGLYEDPGIYEDPRP